MIATREIIKGNILSASDKHVKDLSKLKFNRPLSKVKSSY